MNNRQILSSILFFMLLGFFIGGGVNNELFEFNKTSQSSIEEIGLPMGDPAPDFTLPSIDGSNYTFSSDTGKIRIVTFIATKCSETDSCLLTTQNMASLMQQLKIQNISDNVKFVTVDFDTVNDTMEDLQNFAQTYSQSTTEWQFLLGEANQTSIITELWGYYYQPHDIDHTAVNQGTIDKHEPWSQSYITYVVDQNGNFRYDLIGNFWEVSFAFEIIEFLVNE